MLKLLPVDYIAENVSDSMKKLKLLKLWPEVRQALFCVGLRLSLSLYNHYLCHDMMIRGGCMQTSDWSLIQLSLLNVLLTHKHKLFIGTAQTKQGTCQMVK